MIRTHHAKLWYLSSGMREYIVRLPYSLGILLIGIAVIIVGPDSVFTNTISNFTARHWYRDRTEIAETNINEIVFVKMSDNSEVVKLRSKSTCITFDSCGNYCNLKSKFS